jgi:hypothetical protein
MAEEPEYANYKDKEPTDLQARFPDWLIEKVGLTFPTKKEEMAFREGVRLSTALRMPFQASDENRAATAARRAARGNSTEEAEAPAKKATGRAAKKTAPAAAPASAAPPKTRGRRGPRAATTASVSSENPF